MAQDMFSKWDKEIDIDGLNEDVKAAANGGGGNYKEVPHGNYEVAVQQMELKESKKGKPMVSIWFKIVSDGEYKGSMIFYNQVIDNGTGLHINNEMLRKMVSEMGTDAPVIELKSFEQYSDLLMDIYEAVADNFEYGLKYTANKKNKDFSDFEITDVFVLE
jgi:hypothetical protein|nr:MAG TPA: Protein of unknown function (DUF669) [Bacteriophage sp.]